MISDPSEPEACLENCIYFDVLTGRGTICGQVSISGLLLREGVETIPSLEWLLYVFGRHRIEIETIAQRKFQTGDRWLGGVWVTNCDLNGN